LSEFHLFFLDFLLFTRNIFERSYHSNNLWTKENSRSTSLHTDEHALEFLALHNYEINKAKFFLGAQLSGGKGQALQLPSHSSPLLPRSFSLISSFLK
jgi:hypothetical protein